MAAKKIAKANEEIESELEEKVLFINRCSKVVKGGRKFSFSALVIVGNRNGKIGVGFAKANEVADAIKKATQAAKKNLIEFVLDGTTVPHEVLVTSGGAKILFKPAKKGTGVIAGSKVRSILELGGVKDVMAKSLGSSNPINLVYAAVKGLCKFQSREDIFAARGIAG